MKAYTKQSPPAHLRTWQASRRGWDDFARDATAYEPVKTALRVEQQHLCCYCEAQLVPGDDHIDHFCPRHGPAGNPSRTFDYNNLGCSCNGGSDQNRHCGHHKGHLYDPAQFLNPCVEETDKLYAYDTDGMVSCKPGLSAALQQRVQYMIQTLNLKCPRLANMRRSHAAGLQTIIEGMIDNDAIDQIDELALYYLLPDAEGKLQPFFSLSRQMFGGRADVVLGLQPPA